MMKKILIIICAFAIASLLNGCYIDINNDDSAIVLNSSCIDGDFVYLAQRNNYFKDSFLLENRVSGTIYENEYYDPSDPESMEYIYDSTSPKRIITVIDNLEKHDEIFNIEHEVDFNKEMLVLLFFADTCCAYTFPGAKLKNNNIIIEYTSTITATTSPRRVFFLFRLDKVEYENIEIVRIKKR